MMTADGDHDVVWQQRDDDLSWREIDEEVIILDLQAASYLRLNSAGRVLWHRLEGGATRDELTQTLCEAFGIGADQARADTDTFLAACTAHGLVKQGG